jgi:hypothetical protein
MGRSGAVLDGPSRADLAQLVAGAAVA